MDRSVLADLEDLKRRLAPHLRGARKVIAFGSVARGDFDDWSDLDLIIVADTSRPFFERFRDFRGLHDVWPRLDLLVYTPAELAQMLAEENGFVLGVQYYVPARYPNGLPGGTPADVFTRRQAEEAVIVARRVVGVAQGAIS